VAPSQVDKETLGNVKKALSLTSKDELNNRVAEQIKSPKFYEPV